MKEKWADLLDSRFVRGLTGMIFLFFNIFMLKFGVLLFIYPDYKWLLFLQEFYLLHYMFLRVSKLKKIIFPYCGADLRFLLMALKVVCLKIIR